MAEDSAHDDALVLREDRAGIRTLTLNRPKQLNALSSEMIDALLAELGETAADPSVRVVILAGQGRAFSAGHDLRQMRSHPQQNYYEELFTRCSRLMSTLTDLPQPVIARVQGIATAAGCQLVAACDLAVATNEARFATSGIGVGLFCSTPSVPLSRNVARKHAFEMLFTGDFIDADTACRYGLINRVVPTAELDLATTELAARISEKSPTAVHSGKRMFYQQLGLATDEAYRYAADVMACDMMSDDAVEGIDAFLEKRQPAWRNR